LVNLGVDPHGCFSGDVQIASAETIDLLDIVKIGTRPAGVGLSTRRV